MDEKEKGDVRERLIEVISRLGVAALSEYVGQDKLSTFVESGFELNAYTLAEILVIENGFNVFKNPSIRLELLAGLGPRRLTNSLGISSPDLQSLQNYNAFNWGNNKKSKKILAIFDFSDVELFEESKALVPRESLDITGGLHRYQNWIRKSMNSFLRDPERSRVIVHMPTGSGKTRTTMEAICDHFRQLKRSNTAVVWLAHSEELCEQAIESFSISWRKLGSEDGQVIRLWGGTHLSELMIDRPTFIVISFQTAYGMIMSPHDERFILASKIRAACSLLVVDEAHQSTAPTYADAIQLLSSINSKIIGLTATPGRDHVHGDGVATAELAEFYEQNKIDIVDDEGQPLTDPIKFLTDKGVLAEVQTFRIDSGVDIALTAAEQRKMEDLLDIPKSVLKKLGQDDRRTNLIATHAIVLAIERSFPTIIFAPSKDSAVKLATLLCLKNCEAVAVTSDTPGVERKEAIRRFKDGNLPVLVNYGVLTTGFDAPNIKALIIGRPTTSVVLYSQMVGRGLRGKLMGGEPECYLIDVIDNLTNMPSSSQAFTFFDAFYQNS